MKQPTCAALYIRNESEETIVHVEIHHQLTFDVKAKNGAG